jgi:hypothetical protein
VRQAQAQYFSHVVISLVGCLFEASRRCTRLWMRKL